MRTAVSQSIAIAHFLLICPIKDLFFFLEEGESIVEDFQELIETLARLIAYYS